jgi:hypothetical protein
MDAHALIARLVKAAVDRADVAPARDGLGRRVSLNGERLLPCEDSRVRVMKFEMAAIADGCDWLLIGGRACRPMDLSDDDVSSLLVTNVFPNIAVLLQPQNTSSRCSY